MYQKIINRIELLLKQIGYKRVGKTVFFKNNGSFIKLIKIRKHTILDNFFIDTGLIIKKYRKKQNKVRKNTWSLSCNILYITKNDHYKGIRLEKYLNGEIDLFNDFVLIDEYLDYRCDMNNLKKLVESREIYKGCNPMPLGTVTDIEFENFILNYKDGGN